MIFFFFQAEDGIRYLVRSRGLGDVYKRQAKDGREDDGGRRLCGAGGMTGIAADTMPTGTMSTCLLYTSDAADERSSVDLGGRRIIKKKKKKRTHGSVGQVEEQT